METAAHLSLVPQPEKYFIVQFREDKGQVRIRANSYFITADGTYAFYLDTLEVVNKILLKGQIPQAVFEIPRIFVSYVTEEGASQIMISKNATKKKAKNKKKTVLKKTEKKLSQAIVK